MVKTITFTLPHKYVYKEVIQRVSRVFKMDFIGKEKGFKCGMPENSSLEIFNNENKVVISINVSQMKRRLMGCFVSIGHVVFQMSAIHFNADRRMDRQRKGMSLRKERYILIYALHYVVLSCFLVMQSVY